jgi:hypothetical protein
MGGNSSSSAGSCALLNNQISAARITLSSPFHLSDGSCPSDHWNYGTCPTTGDTSGGVILGIVLTIGGFLAILSLVLLVILLRRLFIQRRAREAIAKHYRRQLQRQTCQLCRDGVAISKCITCKMRLCQHCLQIQSHEGHEIQQLDLTSVNAALEDSPSSSPQDIEKKSLIRPEDNYTTFAAIISQGSAPRSSTIGSFGTFERGQ